MDLLGWTLGGGLLSGDNKWMSAMEIGDPSELEPDMDFWMKIFDYLAGVVLESGLFSYDNSSTNLKMGVNYHFLVEIFNILNQFDYLDDFTNAFNAFEKKYDKIPHEFGLHSRFSQGHVITQPYFIETFINDINITKQMPNCTAIVEHPHLGTENKDEKMIEILTKPKMIETIKNSSVKICWENMPGYHNNKRYYSSLKHMVEFRNNLRDKYRELGYKDLIDRHQFCLDTGHLLVWRFQRGNIKACDKEIEEYLPEFLKYTKVFHIHANDGVADNHLLPGSLDLFDHPTRDWIDPERFMEHSELVMGWMKIAFEIKSHPNMRHLNLELNPPFTRKQLIEFGKKINKLLL